MRSKTLWPLLLIASLALTGCGIFPERVALSREVVWAQMGTPARIVKRYSFEKKEWMKTNEQGEFLM